jgi:hypothetical protein
MTKGRYFVATYLLTIVFLAVLINVIFFLHSKSEQLRELTQFVEYNTNGNLSPNCFIADSVSVHRIISNEVTRVCPDSILFNLFFLGEQSKTKSTSRFLNFLIYTVVKFRAAPLQIEQIENNIVVTYTICCSRKISIKILFSKMDGNFKILKISDYEDLLLFVNSILKYE